MSCTAWDRLLVAWIEASRNYAAAVIASKNTTGVQFENAQRTAQAARLQSLDAERTLREHERQHGCLHGAKAAVTHHAN